MRNNPFSKGFSSIIRANTSIRTFSLSSGCFAVCDINFIFYRDTTCGVRLAIAKYRSLSKQKKTVRRASLRPQHLPCADASTCGRYGTPRPIPYGKLSEDPKKTKSLILLFFACRAKFASKTLCFYNSASTAFPLSRLA